MKLNWQIRFMFSVCEWYTRDDNVRKIASESFASNISPATMPVRGECCMVYWGGGVICTLMSKSYMNYHFLQCIVKPQSGMVIWTVHILKEILDIFTFSEFCKHITSIYIFRIFTKWAFPDYFVFHAPPPLFCNPVTVYRSSLNSEPPVSESDQKLVLMFTWKQVKKCS